jgi:hypothetical protein
MAVFIGGCKNQQQESAEALIQQARQIIGEIGRANANDRGSMKTFDKKYKDMKDSADLYGNIDKVSKESKTELNEQLGVIRVKLDSIENVWVLKCMSGYYKGHGQTGTKIPDWGIVPSGVILTEIRIGLDQQVFISATSPDFERDQTVFKIVNVEQPNDTTLTGYFKNVNNGAKFCSFEWNPKTLKLEGNLWKSDNAKQ